VTSPDFLFALLGVGALGAAALPRLVARRPLSVPLVFLACGMALQLLQVPLPEIDPVADRVWVEHLTEICVIVSLMGAGLALNRPFGRRLWQGTWRQLCVTMPLSIAAVGLLAWGVIGWPPAAALLLAAVLAPTDPVLASEVRVGAPTDSEHDEDEVRFALTSEAGLNDGLAFPFVLGAGALAVAAADGGVTFGGFARWALLDVVFRCAVGVAAGLAVGALLGWLFFRAGWRAMRLSEHREGFVAIGATFLAYGVTELVHGYGFVAVFVTACRIRAAERAHGYHMVLHDFVEQVERLLTAALLFLLGVFVAQGGLAPLTWQGAMAGLLLLFVVRPLTGWLAQVGTAAGPRERAVIAFFGIRGIGSLFYLAYALGSHGFGVPAGELWAVVTLTVVASVVLHGMTASPVISRLDRLRLHRARAGGAGPDPDEDEVASKRL
jgi:NhaP-type Na+/H+ or K+/H+ antiporter